MEILDSTKKYIDVCWDISYKYPRLFENKISGFIIHFFVKWYCLLTSKY